MIISDDIWNHVSATFSPADLAAYYSSGQMEPWVHADHLDLINKAVLMAYKGHIQRIAAFLPPRYGKSYLISRYTPAWWLGMRPDARVVMTSYAHSLATAHSEYARDIINTVGPKLWGVRASGDTRAKDNWGIESIDDSGMYVKRVGGMKAAGITTGIGGIGANLLIVDDPIEGWTEAFSKTIQDRNWVWWKNVASNRMEPGAVVLYIQTRWCEEDLAGQMLRLAKTQPDQKPWVVIRFPEWADVDEMKPISLVGGENNRTQELLNWVEENNADKRYHRMMGEILWPYRWSLVDVKSRKAEKCEGGELEWQAVHQQNPQPSGGLIFKSDFFNIVDTVPVDAIRVRYWDLACTEGGGDWLAGVCMSYSPQERAFYIEDVVRGQWGAGEVEANVQLAAQLDGYQVAIRIEQEGGASGKLTIATFARLLGNYDFKGRPARGPKHGRWRRMVGAMERGNMYLVRGEWNQDFVNELVRLPGGKHDDQADAAAGAYAELVEMDRLTPQAEVM